MILHSYIVISRILEDGCVCVCVRVKFSYCLSVLYKYGMYK